jgi:hypothetical protein
MHDKASVRADETASGGGCPVMHGSSGTASSATEAYNQKVFQACKDQLYAFNVCQTQHVGTDKIKAHCEPEALALRECEIGRRRREKATKSFEECVKKGGDAVTCLRETGS